MGIVAKEAGRVGLALGLGLVAGTVNTVLVLPRAFEGVEEHWGLIRVLTAWSYIIGPMMMLGGPSILLRFSNKLDESLRGALNTSIWLLAFTGLSVWGAVLLFKGDWLMLKLDAEKGGLLSTNLGLFFLMNVLVVSTNVSNALLVIALRTAWAAWILEVWLKTSYLALASMLLFDWITLPTMLQAYVWTWVIALVAMLVGLWHAKSRFSLKNLRFLHWKAHLKYGLYSSLTNGVNIVATNLDFVMIGAILGLSEVPIYTMGYFVGSVVQLPQRAMNQIFSGITSKRVATDPPETLQPYIQQATRVNLLLALAVFAGVFAGIKPLVSALPAAYTGIFGVAIAIGLQKIVLAMTLTPAQIIAHTPHYRLNLPLNVGLLITTVFTNWLLMSNFGWGATGAALATLFTAIWNSTWRIVILHQKVGIHPFSREWIPLFGLTVAVLVAAWFIPVGWTEGHGYVEAAINGGAAATLAISGFYFLGTFPELKSALEKHVFSRFN